MLNPVENDFVVVKTVQIYQDQKASRILGQSQIVAKVSRDEIQ
jgi:hypothetical protein